MNGWRVAAGAGFATFAVYAATLSAGLAPGDSGELLAAAFTGGIAHPPGYPLQAALLQLWWTVTPGQPDALSANLLNALLAAAAIGVFAAAAARLCGSAPAACAAAAWVAFHPLAWEHATGYEVFALNQLMAACALLCAVNFHATPRRRYFLGIVVLSGLAVSHHHTLVLLTVPIAVWMLHCLLPAHGIRGLWPATLACAAVSLLPQLLLLRSAGVHSPVSWGDPSTFSGWLHHLLRSDYGTLQLAADSSPEGTATVTQLMAFAAAVGTAGYWLELPLAALGWFLLLRARTSRAFALTIGVSLVLLLPGFHLLANLSATDPLMRSVLGRFWLLPTMLLGLPLAVALTALIRLSRNHGLGHIAMAVAALFIATPILRNAAFSDRSDQTEFNDYGQWILDSAPANAVLLLRGDLIVNCAHYQHFVAKQRQDLILIDLERLTYPWHPPQIRAYAPTLDLPLATYDPSAGSGLALPDLLHSFGNRPVIFVGNLTAAERASVSNLSLRPWGPGVRIQHQPAAGPIDQWWATSAASLPNFPLPPQRRIAAGSWSYAVAHDMTAANLNRAAFLLSFAIQQPPPQQQQLLHHAIDALLQIPSPMPQAIEAAVKKNLGIAYARLMAEDQAYTDLWLQAWHAFLRLAPNDDPDRHHIQTIIDQYEPSSSSQFH